MIARMDEGDYPFRLKELKVQYKQDKKHISGVKIYLMKVQSAVKSMMNIGIDTSKVKQGLTRKKWRAVIY